MTSSFHGQPPSNPSSPIRLIGLIGLGSLGNELNIGVGRWTHKTRDGRGIRKTIAKLKRYVDGDQPYSFQPINETRTILP